MGSTMGRRLPGSQIIDEGPADCDIRVRVQFTRRGPPAPPGTPPSDRSAQGGKPDDHALDTPRTSADHWVEIAAFLEEKLVG